MCLGAYVCVHIYIFACGNMHSRVRISVKKNLSGVEI